MNYTIEKAENGTWKIGNGTTFLAGFNSKMEAKFFVKKYVKHREAGKISDEIRQSVSHKSTHSRPAGQ